MTYEDRKRFEKQRSLIAVLIDEAPGGNRFLTDEVLSALGRIKDKRAVEPLIELRRRSWSWTHTGINEGRINEAHGDITVRPI